MFLWFLLGGPHGRIFSCSKSVSVLLINTLGLEQCWDERIHLFPPCNPWSYDVKISMASLWLLLSTAPIDSRNNWPLSVDAGAQWHRSKMAAKLAVCWSVTHKVWRSSTKRVTWLAWFCAAPSLAWNCKAPLGAPGPLKALWPASRAALTRCGRRTSHRRCHRPTPTVSAAVCFDPYA